MKNKMIALLLGITVLGTTIGGNVVLHAQDSSSSSMDGAVIDLVSTVESGEDGFSYSSVADVAEAVMPSIVAITNKSVQEVQSFFYGARPFQYESESAGSGIIVDSNDTELLICTNNHVVEDATELTVSFIDDESYPAVVKGTDPSNDLAVVAVNLDDISDDTMDASPASATLTACALVNRLSPSATPWVTASPSPPASSARRIVQSMSEVKIPAMGTVTDTTTPRLRQPMSMRT